MTEPVRLAKRLAEMLSCSRRQAEQYIEGGWVSVAGEVIQEPQYRVLDHKITLDPDANLLASTPVTLLLHKPAGFDAQQGPQAAAHLLTPNNLWAGDGGGLRPLRRHFQAQACLTPLENAASGLLIFTQEWRVQRKLTKDVALIEQELMVEIDGAVAPDALLRLNRNASLISGVSVKVSLSSDKPGLTTLRFAIKGNSPGLIARLCEQVGLTIVALKRSRLGRLALGGLPSGEWRFLGPHERV